MTFGRFVLGIIAVAIGLPLALILIAVATIRGFDRSNGSIVSSGDTRQHLLYVPDTYDPAKPTALVISLHGGALWPAHQQNLTHWNGLADANGFIVVYPSGTPQLLGVVRAWNSFEIGPGVKRDVVYISELIDALQAVHHIDRDRIYVDGLSNGGGMAYVLACTMADRIAAVAMVAPAQSLPAGWCTSTRPIPMMAFHGTADPIVPYDGGPLGDPFNPVKPVFAPVRDFVATWAERNGCATGGPVESTVAPDVTLREYTECDEDAVVALYTVVEGGHTWPGGKPMPKWWVGPTSNSIDATSAIWAFFRQHPLRRAPI